MEGGGECESVERKSIENAFEQSLVQGNRLKRGGDINNLVLTTLNDKYIQLRGTMEGGGECESVERKSIENAFERSLVQGNRLKSGGDITNLILTTLKDKYLQSVWHVASYHRWWR